jgi:ubiquinone/menaquinone biosynthesis C-methylase UbiE
MPSAQDPTQRFSSRVACYVKYRPRYPKEILSFLAEEIGLNPDWEIADIGSGTGILSDLFLSNGNTVYGVEPNRDMRTAAEHLLIDQSRFISVDGRAEATALPDGCVQLITAGQAFHWFEADGARDEFLRILRPGGWVTVIWNTRKLNSSPFLNAYEDLLDRYAIDYREIDHRRIDHQVLSTFFRRYTRQVFYNCQSFDLEGLKGRTLSSSYMPMEGHPAFENMIAELGDIFQNGQQDGLVQMEYDCEVYCGQL